MDMFVVWHACVSHTGPVAALYMPCHEWDKGGGGWGVMAGNTNHPFRLNP